MQKSAPDNRAELIEYIYELLFTYQGIYQRYCRTVLEYIDKELVFPWELEMDTDGELVVVLAMDTRYHQYRHDNLWEGMIG